MRTLPLLRAVLMVIACTLAQPTLADQSVSASGTNRPGSDYRDFALEPSIAGFAPCESACMNDAKCQAWTFVRSGIQGTKAHCWLKNVKPAPVADNCCVSGTREKDVTAGSGLCDTLAGDIGEARRLACPFISTMKVPDLQTCLSMPPSVMQGLDNTIKGRTAECRQAAAGGGGPSSTSSLGADIVKFARDNLNHCFDRQETLRNQPCPPLPMGSVGDGECTDLVRAALDHVHAKFQANTYSWGRKVADSPFAASDDIQPGDIIQLTNVKLERPNGWWETSSQHSAIVESNSNGVLTVLEQNTWDGQTNRRFVTRGTIDLTWKLTRGNWTVYRAEKAGGQFARRMEGPDTTSGYRQIGQ